MLRARCRPLGLFALALTLGVTVPAAAQPVGGPPLESVANPRTTYGGWVTDPSGALGGTGAEIDALLGALHRDTGAEVAVVVLPTIGGAVPKTYATALFKHWGVGRKGHDDGVLVLQVLDQRRVEIETGYGVEGALPDVKCAWLIREAATPRLREGDFGGGQLAIARGIAYGIRNPTASLEALLRAAQGQESDMPVAAGRGAQPLLQTPAPAPASSDFRWPLGVSLAACLLVLGGVWALRMRAHAALYLRSEFRPETPLVMVVIGLAFTAFFLLFVSAFSVQVGLGVGNVAVLVMTAVLGRNTIKTFARARRRYAPRSCSACGGALALMNDKYDDAMLDGGRAAEERIGAVNYDVWRCSCGKLSIEEFEVTAGARRCPKCSYRTQQVVRSEVLKRASTSSAGLRKLYLKCEHCSVEDTEEQVIPRESSHSSSSSGGGGGGSSFGGGRSGGGGAGGSY